MFGRLGIQFAVLMLCGPYHDLFRLAPGMVRAKGDKREAMNSESVRFGFVARSLIVLASVGAGTGGGGRPRLFLHAWQTTALRQMHPRLRSSPEEVPAVLDNQSPSLQSSLFGEIGNGRRAETTKGHISDCLFRSLSRAHSALTFLKTLGCALHSTQSMPAVPAWQDCRTSR